MKFAANNPYASLGGKARAEKLTAEQRRAIAHQDWLAFVQKYFAGDTAAAIEYVGALGAWGGDVLREQFSKVAKPQLPIAPH